MKRTFFFVLVLEGVIGLCRPLNFSFFGIRSWGIYLHYCDVEWFALETNRDHSVIFEVAPKYCISNFQTLLLIMGTIPFFLWDSCPQ